MKHVVLLGDSIFDNAAYVHGGRSVIEQLRKKLPGGWEATLRAVDGSVIEDVHWQLKRLPQDASHLVISAGGNDAIRHADILSGRVQAVAEVLNLLADVSERFEQRYYEMLRAAMKLSLPLAAASIYYPRFPDRQLQRIAVAALTIFNDAIIRQAFMAGIPLIDLRLVCSDDADYANEIEPSVQGGGKITDAILQLLTEHRFDERRTQIFI
jgi:hypothetical protein